MIIPPYLKKGDTIGIVAPSGKIDYNIIKKASQRLKDNGFNVRLAKHVKGNYYNFSANDSNRLSDLQQMLDAPDINAIICTRGGYGMIRIVDNLDFSGIQKFPKWVVGFSDITILHSALNKNKIASIHGPMLKTFLDYTSTGACIDVLLAALQGEELQYAINSHIYNIQGTAKGTLIGGNLSTLYSLRSTPYDFNPKGKILFIEDLSEYLYHLDRMMHNLKIGNVLSNLSGLIIGQFTEMKDNKNPFGYGVDEIIYNLIKDYNYPVAFNFPTGHIPNNYPLILGSNITLNINKNDVILDFEL